MCMPKAEEVLRTLNQQAAGYHAELSQQDASETE